ncbi:TY-Chap domain-containing protein [Monashia sp. NPDC004114]
MTWNAWVQRISGDLAALSGGDWLTFTVRADSAPVGASVADVLVQARPLEGVLALECIADTEFEGLTDLTAAQQSALVELGWEQDGDDPDYERTFAPEDTTSAAQLVAATLRDVLGAGTPDEVDVRRRDLG